jgi:hypothetical protein
MSGNSLVIIENPLVMDAAMAEALRGLVLKVEIERLPAAVIGSKHYSIPALFIVGIANTQKPGHVDAIVGWLDRNIPDWSSEGVITLLTFNEDELSISELH